MARTRYVKAEAELVRQREDRLDNILFECLEIMKMPEKWAIDRQGNFNIVYPHPMVKREANRIEGIQYLPHKSYNLPIVLLERLLYWEEITKGIALKGNRKPYTKVTPNMVAEIVKLREQGLTMGKIAKQVGVSEHSVRHYLRAGQKQIEAVAN
ncbi:hypothetical protein JOC77_000552 [Peribacillus deserti]|uniref:Resolvase HTH domain-containing protein n=1 Tax=Peribacillus deserti TaxID=673318 RepID=A0ABS2QDA0_9BACI|nr:helix-turn-helix domain-containing protein [Peribacillus deserti]MBM7691147.1 hypothetical protein [Peribacillus deserti]